MTFVTPALVAGTLLVAVPIVLHLIMRQKPKRLEFPALRFVARRHETNQRRLRLRHLLLLLLRAGAIALLALALARPTVRWAGAVGSQEAPVAAVLVFDAAPRMQYRAENRTRLEAAQQFGTWLLGQLPRNSQIAVLDTRLGPSAFEVDLGSARDRIRRLDPVANSQPLPVVVEEALRLLAESDLSSREVYVFTDLSRAAWPEDEAARLRDRLAAVPGAAVYLLDVGAEQPANYSLGELRLSSQVLSSRGTLQVETALQRMGEAGERTIELAMVDAEGNRQRRSQQTVQVEADQSQRVEFRIGGLEVGTHQGEVRIAGQDALAEDDARFFTVEVQPPWRILVAAPDPADAYALYLTEALSPSVFRKRGQTRFECEVIPLAALPDRLAGDWSAVCLLDPVPLEPALWKRLADFASEGRGVAVFLGRNAAAVDSFNEPLAQAILPGALLRQSRRPDGDVYLAPSDYQHPVTAAFRGQADAVPWSAFPVFRYWQLGTLAPAASVVIPFSDGAPALVERPVGNGRALTLTTPISDRPQRNPWNLLPVGEAWPFLILANELAAYLVGSSEEQLNYTAGQTAALRLDPAERRPRYTLSTPGGLKLPVTPDLNRNLLLVSAIDEPGNYRLQAGGREGFDRGFSVNLVPRQTELRRIDQEHLQRIFGPVPFQLARDRKQLEGKQREARVGRELFTPLMLVLILVLGAEHFMSNRFYRE
ncbi:MAG: BatA domain-containing protein [Thermoguttaceae bacterium]|jgi:hypothetical protein|nr:BatA domain-containing protein [Thermoguttaceae bacterium]